MTFGKMQLALLAMALLGSVAFAGEVHVDMEAQRHRDLGWFNWNMFMYKLNHKCPPIGPLSHCHDKVLSVCGVNVGDFNKDAADAIDEYGQSLEWLCEFLYCIKSGGCLVPVCCPQGDPYNTYCSELLEMHGMSSNCTFVIPADAWEQVPEEYQEQVASAYASGVAGDGVQYNQGETFKDRVEAGDYVKGDTNSSPAKAFFTSFWTYLAIGAAVMAAVAFVIYRRRRAKNALLDGEHVLHGGVGKRREIVLTGAITLADPNLEPVTRATSPTQFLEPQEGSYALA